MGYVYHARSGTLPEPETPLPPGDPGGGNGGNGGEEPFFPEWAETDAIVTPFDLAFRTDGSMFVADQGSIPPRIIHLTWPDELSGSLSGDEAGANFVTMGPIDMSGAFGSERFYVNLALDDAYTYGTVISKRDASDYFFFTGAEETDQYMDVIYNTADEFIYMTLYDNWGGVITPKLIRFKADGTGLEEQDWIAEHGAKIPVAFCIDGSDLYIKFIGDSSGGDETPVIAKTNWAKSVYEVWTPTGMSNTRSWGTIKKLDDYLYIADPENSRIIRAEFGGAGMTTYGSDGTGEGEFFSSMGGTLGFDIYQGSMAVADPGNLRIVVFPLSVFDA